MTETNHAQARELARKIRDAWEKTTAADWRIDNEDWGPHVIIGIMPNLKDRIVAQFNHHFSTDDANFAVFASRNAIAIAQALTALADENERLTKDVFIYEEEAKAWHLNAEMNSERICELAAENERLEAVARNIAKAQDANAQAQLEAIGLAGRFEVSAHLIDDLGEALLKAEKKIERLIEVVKAGNIVADGHCKWCGDADGHEPDCIIGEIEKEQTNG